MEQPPHPRRLGDDEQQYFLGLPATGRPDDRAGDISGAEPKPINQGIKGRSSRRRTPSGPSVRPKPSVNEEIRK